MPRVTGTPDGDSRDFCQMMVGAGNRVWKKEDIEAASGANPGWGPGGARDIQFGSTKGAVLSPFLGEANLLTKE